MEIFLSNNHTILNNRYYLASILDGSNHFLVIGNNLVYETVDHLEVTIYFFYHYIIFWISNLPNIFPYFLFKII